MTHKMTNKQIKPEKLDALC